MLIQVVLTMVVSVMDPKLLMKILHVTFTGGPEDRTKQTNIIKITIIVKQI